MTNERPVRSNGTRNSIARGQMLVITIACGWTAITAGYFGQPIATAHFTNFQAPSPSAEKIDRLRSELKAIRQQVAVLEEQLKNMEAQTAQAPLLPKPDARQPEQQDHGTLLLTDPNTIRKLTFINSEIRNKIKDLDIELAKNGLDGLSGAEATFFHEYEELFDPHKIRALYLQRMETPTFQKFIALSDFESREQLEDACILFYRMSFMDQRRVISILENAKSGLREITEERSRFVFAHRTVFGIR